MGRLARLLALPLFALSLSCADMPTAPRGYVDLTGRILDRDGAGLATHVYFVSVARALNEWGYEAPEFSVVAFTDVSGAYRVRLPAGAYDVWINSEFFNGYPTVELPHVEIAEDHPTFNYQFGGVRVMGAITGPGGALLQSATVIAYRRSPPYASAGSSAFAGQYSLVLPPGSYEFQFRPSAASGLPFVVMHEVEVVSDTTINVSLDGQPITGTVTGPDGPLGTTIVSAMGGGYGNIISYVQTDAGGTYALWVPTGSYFIRIDPRTSSHIADRTFGPFAIDAPRTLDFDISGIEWTGFVRSAIDSTPLPNASIRVAETTLFGTADANAETDASGAFRLVVRPGGLYRLNAGWQDQTTRMTIYIPGIIAGSDSTFDVYLNPYTEYPWAPPPPRSVSDYAKPSGGAKWAGTLGGRSRISP